MPGQQQMVREEYLIPSCAQSLLQTPASVQECVRQASQVAQLMHSRRTPAAHTEDSGIQAPQSISATKIAQATNVTRTGYTGCTGHVHQHTSSHEHNKPHLENPSISRQRNVRQVTCIL